MIDIQWGDFILKADGTAAILLLAIPVLLIMQIPAINKMLQLLARRTRLKVTSSLAYRVKRAERR